MTMTDADQMIDTIQGFLEEHGWDSQALEGHRWVDHTFDNGTGVLSADYVPTEPDRLGFGFETGEREVYLNIRFDADPAPVLSVITRYQDGLSEQTWPAFIGELLRTAQRVAATSGDDGDEETVIHTTGEGAEALAERDWEYYDESRHSPEDIIGP